MQFTNAVVPIHKHIHTQSECVHGLLFEWKIEIAQEIHLPHNPIPLNENVVHCRLEWDAFVRKTIYLNFMVDLIWIPKRRTFGQVKSNASPFHWEFASFLLLLCMRFLLFVYMDASKRGFGLIGSFTFYAHRFALGCCQMKIAKMQQEHKRNVSHWNTVTLDGIPFSRSFTAHCQTLASPRRAHFFTVPISSWLIAQYVLIVYKCFVVACLPIAVSWCKAIAAAVASFVERSLFSFGKSLMQYLH